MPSKLCDILSSSLRNSITYLRSLNYYKRFTIKTSYETQKHFLRRKFEIECQQQAFYHQSSIFWYFYLIFTCFSRSMPEIKLNLSLIPPGLEIQLKIE